MLSNKDFAALLTSEDASLAASGGGKVRFDLKQISTWDKQNNSKFKKSKGAGGVTPNKPADSGDVDNTEDGVGKGKAGGNRGGYRDRAFERRKDINKEGDEMEAVASKLDAEQTKFLGGDMEHTHLVKGLDYALLRKVRGEAGESTSSGAQQASEPSRDDTSAKETRDYQPSTAVGMQIKMLLPLLSNRKSNDRSANLTSSKRGVVGAVAGGTTAPSASAPSSLAASSLVTTFARLGFDFDLNPASDVDIPTAIMGSKQVSGFVQYRNIFSLLCTVSYVIISVVIA
jgi:IK cytokine